MDRTLTPSQERVLLHKYLTGDFDKHTWPTIKALLDQNFLECTTSREVKVTQKGRLYCDEYLVIR